MLATNDLTQLVSGLRNIHNPPQSWHRPLDICCPRQDLDLPCAGLVLNKRTIGRISRHGLVDFEHLATSEFGKTTVSIY
jgi:hypothetical protein